MTTFTFTKIKALKNITPISIILFFLLIGTLFLPYLTIIYETSNFFYDTPKGQIGNNTIAGINLTEVYPMILAFLLIVLTINIKKSYITALVGFIFSALLLISMPILAFALSFYIFGPKKELEFGFFLAVIIVLIQAVILLINMIKMRRKQKKMRQNFSASDLLDDI